MDPYIVWNVVKSLLVVAVLLLAAWVLIKDHVNFEGWRLENKHKANKRRLSGSQPLDRMGVNGDEARQASLSFTGAPDIEADTILEQIPIFGDPVKRQAVVIGNYRIFIYTAQDTSGRPMDFLELDQGYALLMTGKNVMLLKQRLLTTKEEKELELERQEAVEKNDGSINSLFGTSWFIKGAFGTNMDWQEGERKCSFMQALSASSQFPTVLPEDLCDGEEHDYFDIIATNDQVGTEAGKEMNPSQALYGFYVRGSWLCFLGCILDQADVASIKVMYEK